MAFECCASPEALTQWKSEASALSRRSGVGIRYAVVELFYAGADVVIIVLASLFGGAVYHLAQTDTIGDVEIHVAVGVITALIYLIGAYHSHLYRIQELFREGRDYQQVLANWALAILVLTVILFVLKLGGEVSRGSVICFAVIGGFCLAWWRRIAKRQLRRGVESGLIRTTRVVVIGETKELALFGESDFLAMFGVDEIERVILPPSAPENGGPQPSRALAAAVEAGIQRARDVGAEEVILAFPWDDVVNLKYVRDQLRLLPIPVHLLLDQAVAAVLSHQAIEPTSYLMEVQRAPLSPIERMVKRLFDIAVASAALLAVSPLMIVTAIAIAIDSRGPIIFRQRRKGFNDKEFVIYKFRSMNVLEDGPTIVQAKKDDRRVTRLGRFLRQTSIDELPQLLNVIKGDMSVVGPRPHAIAHDDEYGQIIANYAFRHHVRPGITGWAQVHGYRGRTKRLRQMAKRVEYDLWYINNWSIGLDLQILLRTCLELLRGRNAY